MGAARAMNTEETQAIVDRIRLIQAETPLVELKAARGGLPKALKQTLSAFANDSGGVVLLGLTDPSTGAEPVEGFDADKTRDGAMTMLAQDFTPPIPAEVTIETVDDGARIVRIDIPELTDRDKPCFITAAGRRGGSYTRIGDGERRLTDYEIDRLLENTRQPKHDQELVEEALPSDLDPDLVTSYVSALRESQPNAFQNADADTILIRTRILGRDADGVLHPTVGGILTLGAYPQQFFPQLGITVVVLPRIRMGEADVSGRRFLDNRSCTGPIGMMIEESLNVLKRAMARASVIGSDALPGLGREDRYEYPLRVLRELIVNAILHRDYSPQSRGSQVQVELYPDRLVVRNPGGFFGGITGDRLGEQGLSASRNASLATILSDAPSIDGGAIVENRASGIPTVFRELLEAGMEPPIFEADLNRVEVTIRHSALLSKTTLEWIASLNAPDLTEPQIQALALMLNGRSASNGILQGWGLHPADATRSLTDLVRRGLVEKIGDGRWTRYRLSAAVMQVVPPLTHNHQSRGTWDVDSSSHTENTRIRSPKRPGEERQQRILQLLRERGSLSTSEIAEEEKVSTQTVRNALRPLLESNLIVPTGSTKSPKRRYILNTTSPDESSESMRL